VPQQDRERGGGHRLEEVQRAELAAAGRGLDAGDDGRHEERGQRLPGEQQRGDRQGAVGVVEYGERQGDQADPAPQPVDRVGGEDPAQPGDFSGDRTPPR
jgi:hypothetical protein